MAIISAKNLSGLFTMLIIVLVMVTNHLQSVIIPDITGDAVRLVDSGVSWSLNSNAIIMQIPV